MIRKFDLALQVLKMLLLIKQFESLWYVWKPLRYRNEINLNNTEKLAIKYLWQISKLSGFWAPTLHYPSHLHTPFGEERYVTYQVRLYSPNGHWVIDPKSEKVMESGIRPMFNDSQVRVLFISVSWTVFFFFSRAGNWTWASLMLSNYSTRKPISLINNPF